MYKKNAKWILLGILLIIVLAMLTASFGKYTESFNMIITLNITKPTYTVRFHPNNGGTDNYTTQSFTYGISQALDPNPFTNGNLVLHEWTTNADGTGDSYQDEEVITTGLTQTNGAVVDLYAKWSGAEYWVTFNYGNESFTGPTDRIFINSGMSLFSQANIDRDFEVSCTVSNFSKVANQDRDVIIDHQYEDKRTYPGFSFGYRDGAITVHVKSNSTSEYKEPWGKTSGTITFTKEGAGANRKMYVDGVEVQSLANFASTFDETLVFGCNRGEAGTEIRFLNADLSNMTIKLKYSYAEVQQLFSNLPTPTRTNYAFDGWYTEASGGTQVTSSTTIASTNITLYARWESAGLVNFIANGGTGTMNSQAFSPSQSQALTKNAFSRTGYSFVGWNTSPDGSGTSYTDMQQIMCSETINLYAQWEAFHTGTDYFYANGSVIFNKKNSDIVNTGINLFSQANYSRNFELYFEIQEVGTNSNQAVLVNSKDETATPWPGFVFRVQSSTQLQLKADRDSGSTNSHDIRNISIATTQSIRIIRIGGETYYSINNGTYQSLLDYNNFESTATFNAPVAFGGAIKPNGDMLRPFNGTLANMFVGFIDSNITLSDYQNGYTAPRTGT